MSDCELVSDFEECVYSMKNRVTPISINIFTSGPNPNKGHAIIYMAAFTRIPTYAKNFSYCDYYRPKCNVDVEYVKRIGMDWFLRKDSMYEDANTVYGGWLSFIEFMNQFSDPVLDVSVTDRAFLINFHTAFLEETYIKDDSNKYPWLYLKYNEMTIDCGR